LLVRGLRGRGYSGVHKRLRYFFLVGQIETSSITG